MRLFAAVDPPAAEVDALRSLIAGADDRLRWVAPEQWHVTLAFYGEVDDSRAADLSQRLARAAARTPPFGLQLTGAGTFPAQPRRARTLWLGIGGDVETLTRLAERCVAAGRRAGVAMEDRRFRPHLTLARARGGPADMTTDVAPLQSWQGEPWQVCELRLVRSTLGARVEHATLAAWPLDGHQA